MKLNACVFKKGHLYKKQAEAMWNLGTVSAFVWRQDNQEDRRICARWMDTDNVQGPSVTSPTNNTIWEIQKYIFRAFNVIRQMGYLLKLSVLWIIGDSI